MYSIIELNSNSMGFNGINSQLNRNEMQISGKGTENLFMILIIHDYGVEKTDPKRHLCKILHTILNILFRIITIKDRTKHLHYTNFKFLVIEIPIIKKLLQFPHAQKSHVTQHHMLKSYAYIYMFWNLVCKWNVNNFGEISHGHFNSKFKTSITLIFGEMYVEKT